MSIVYLNGQFVAQEQALVPVEDRGFLFADGVYEVTPAYGGRFFLWERHRDRLARGLGELRIAADTDGLEAVHQRLLDENGLSAAPIAYVYLQITRGVAPRTHAFPREPVEPTVYGFAREYVRPSAERWERGFHAITVPDRRWSRLDLKTVCLLPNVLAQQAAAEAGVDDALFVRDGVVLEGAHNNFFAVFGRQLVTHPATHQILGGITRGLVIEMSAGLGLDVAERALQIEELAHADEAFFTGTTTEVRPAVTIDGHEVGDGRVGPVSRQVFAALRARAERVSEGAPAG